MTPKTWQEVVDGEASVMHVYVISRILGEGLIIPAAVTRSEQEAEELSAAFNGVIKEVPLVNVEG